MLYINTAEKIADYFASSGEIEFSQSKGKRLFDGLKNFLKDPFESKDDKYKDQPFLQLGNAVDDILLGEEGLFEKNFYIDTQKSKPSDAIMNICRGVYKYIEEKCDFDNQVGLLDKMDITEEPAADTFPVQIRDIVVGMCRHFNYQDKWKEHTVAKDILKKGSAYYNSLVEAGDRTIIDQEQKKIIDSCVERLKNDPRTAIYFNREQLSVAGNLEAYYQFMHKWTQIKYGFNCKLLSDLVLFKFDKDEKGVVRKVKALILDLKTYGQDDTINTFFNFSIDRLRYDFQCAHYSFGLRDYLEKRFGDSVVIDITFGNIVVSTLDLEERPYVFIYEKELVERGTYGIVNTYGDKVDIYKPGILHAYGVFHLYKQKNFKKELVMYTYNETDNIRMGVDGPISKDAIVHNKKYKKHWMRAYTDLVRSVALKKENK